MGMFDFLSGQQNQQGGIFGGGGMGYAPQLGILASALQDAGAQFSGHPADANHLNQQILLNRQMQAQQALQATPYTGDAQSYMQALVRSGVPVETALQAAAGQRSLAGVKTLSPTEAAALGFKPGSVIQQDASGKLDTAQQSDLMSQDAVNQQLGMKKSEGDIAGQAPLTKYQKAEIGVQQAQLNKPVPLGMGDNILYPGTGKIVQGPSLFGAAPTTTPGAPLATGQDYLKTLSPQVAGVVKSIGDGKMSLTGFARNPAMGMQLRQMVTQYNPDYDETTMPTRAAGRKNFINSADGKSVTAISTAVDHLGTLGQLADALHNGDIQAFNALGQAYSQQTGNAAPTNFDTAKQVVGDEIVKALTGSGGAIGDREEAKATISRASSPQQLAGAIDTYQKLLAGKLGPLRQKYQFNTKLQDFSDMLTPETNKVLGSLPQGGVVGNGPGKPSAPVNASQLPQKGATKIRVYNPATGKLE